MTTRHRTSVMIAALALGTAGLLGTAACSEQGLSPQASDSAAEEQALVTAGFETEASPAPDPGASPAPDPAASPAPDRKNGERGHGAALGFLRKNTLHGELKLQTKKGIRTVLVQRGTVTAADATTVTVESADGFSLKWTFGEKLNVRIDKKEASSSDLKVGAEVGIAGARDGDKTAARLIRVK